MSSIQNFSCSNPDLSREYVTEEVWTLTSGGTAHENSIIIMAVFLILFIFIGIPWNTIVVVAILREKLYKEPTYILLLNLIFADLFVILFVMPLDVNSALAMEFTLGNSDYVRCQVCHTIAGSTLTMVLASLFFLSLMSLDRLVYIKRPITYNRYVNVRVTVIVIVAVWIFCAIVSTLPIFGIGELRYSNILSACSLVVAGRTHLTSNINFVLILIFADLLPFMTAIVANIWLLILVCQSLHSQYRKRKNIANPNDVDIPDSKNSENQAKKKYYKQQLYLTQVFGAIFATNIISWIPSILISVVAAIIGPQNVPPSTFLFVFLIYLSQPAVHPIIETCLIGKARNTVWKCLCICHKKGNSNSSGSARV